MPESSAPSAKSLPVTLEALAQALQHPARWRLLAQLAGGEALMVLELAERTGAQREATSKHLIWLRQAGLVTKQRNGLDRLSDGLAVDAAAGTVDLGFCL